MNLLIITPFYKQDRCIGSIRWTNLAQRLAKKHNVIVVSQPLDDMDMRFTKAEEDNLLIVRLNQKTAYEKIAVKHFHGVTGEDLTIGNVGENKSANKTVDNKESVSRRLKNKLFYSTMKRKAKSYASFIVKNVIPKGTIIDVVISSACPFIEMLFGYELKKRLGCKWISDFRDLPFIEDNCDDTHIQKKIMQDVLPNADAITVVINNMKVELLNWLDIQNTKIHILTNGFSIIDYKEAEIQKDDVLHIVYTGSLYGGTLKPDALYKAMNLAKANNPNIRFSVEFAGGNNTSAIEAAKRYQLHQCVKDNGFLSRDEALSLQGSADYLLAIIRNIPGKGFAAKLFEYVLNQKNIICLLTDDYYEKTDAESFIEDLNVGIVIKETDDEVNKLAEYLLNGHKRKVNGLSPLYNPNVDELQKYNHDSLTKHVEQICYELVE